MAGQKITLNPQQKTAWIGTLRDALRIVEEIPAVQRCADCADFDETTGCLKFGAMPPVEYQLSNDCDAWSYIPF